MSANITNHEIEKHRINHTAPLLKAGQEEVLAAKAKTRKLMAIPLLMATVLAVLFIAEKWGGVNALSEPIGGNSNYYLYAAIVSAVIAFFIFLFGSAEGKADTLYDDIVNSWGELLSWEVLDPSTLDNLKQQPGPVGELVAGEIGKGLSFADVTGFRNTVLRRIQLTSGEIISCQLDYDTEVETGENEDGVTQTQQESHNYFKGVMLFIPINNDERVFVYPSKEFGTMMERRSKNTKAIHDLDRLDDSQLQDGFVAFGGHVESVNSMIKILQASVFCNKNIYVTADSGTLHIAINTNSVELSANEVLKDNADKLIREHLQCIDKLMNEIANIYG